MSRNTDRTMINVGIRLEASMKLAVEVEATRQDRSMNWIIIKAIDEYLKTCATERQQPGHAVQTLKR